MVGGGEMGSNEAWRKTTSTFDAVMEKAKSVIDQALLVGVEGELQALLFYLLYDAYRTGVSMEVLVRQGLIDERIPADSVEVLARQILERVIFSSYARKQDPAEIVDRWSKTRALEWKEKWGQSVDLEAEKLPVKRLPSYRQMAENVGSDTLWEAYRRLSYFSHPRLVSSYTEVELATHLSPKQFFRQRVQEALRVTCPMLTILTTNFLESQQESVDTGTSP